MSTTRLLRDVSADLDAAGLRGHFLVRDLDSGEEVGLGPDVGLPLASVVKVPLALAVLERVAHGELDAATPLRLAPGGATVPGPIGLTKFRFEATVALGDVVYLSTSLSDSVAADALLDLVPPAVVTERLRELGVHGLTLRHRLGDLTETPVEAMVATTGLAHLVAACGGTPGGGHHVPELDVTRANAGTARACVDLLALLWDPSGTPDGPDPAAAAGVRELMADNVMRQRLWPDLASDASRWASKTGTVLNYRHEIGVVEHDDGGRFAIAALTESRVAAAVQPAAEATMGSVARRLRDHLRA